MGFYGVYRCGDHSINTALITALVERWRSETHTFHLTIGEATATLQDVSYLYALPIEGCPVISSVVESGIPEMCDLCEELLRWRPNADHFKSGNLHMVTLGAVLMGRIVNDDTPAVEVDQYACGVVLILFGSILCPNTSGSYGSIAYLPQLSDIQACKGYSWGSAVLSYLYNQLCLVSTRRRDNIAGATQLLQIWAWSRITFLQPTLGRERLQMGQYPLPNGDVLPVPPMGAEYLREQECGHVLRHEIRPIRATFDNQDSSEFIWDPYTTSNSSALQAYLSAGIIVASNTWLCECPLIHYNIVELYHPSRVLRQFGYRQTIPPVIPPNHRSLHHASRKANNKSSDWMNTHRDQIIAWLNRHERIQVGHVIQLGEPEVDANYMQWYDGITRRINTPSVSVPSGYQPPRKTLVERLVKHLGRIRMFTRSSQNVAPTDRLRLIEGVCEEAEDDIREARVIIYDEEGQHVVPPAASPPPDASPPPPVSVPHRRRGSSRRRSMSSSPHEAPPTISEGVSTQFGLATPVVEEQPYFQSFTQMLLPGHQQHLADNQQPWHNPFNISTQPPHFNISPIPFHHYEESSSRNYVQSRHSFHSFRVGQGSGIDNENEGGNMPLPRRNARRAARDTHPPCGTKRL